MLLDDARKWWGWITLRRHRSELRALRIARSLRLLAIFPIFMTVAFWWFLFCLPGILVAIPIFSLLASPKPVEHLLGGVIVGVLYAIATFMYLIATLFLVLPALFFAAPWFFRWYFIAVALMFNRPGMADRKESELVSVIRHAEATTGSN